MWYFCPVISKFLKTKKMSETTMPAAEAVDRNSYELAFHVLPTVAEGEVSGVFDAVKALITTNGGELFDEESPERFDLAYEIIKPIEGKNRKFTSAYFGWVRFTAEAEVIAILTEELETNTNLLRHLLIKLTKVEEANPFRFHEAMAAEKTVSTVDEAPAKKVEEKKAPEAQTAEEPAVEVKDAEIDEALEKKEA